MRFLNFFKRLEEERQVYEEKNSLIENLSHEKSILEKQIEEVIYRLSKSFTYFIKVQIRK